MEEKINLVKDRNTCTQKLIHAKSRFMNMRKSPISVGISRRRHAQGPRTANDILMVGSRQVGTQNQRREKHLPRKSKPGAQ
jgi:hypothetical protein